MPANLNELDSLLKRVSSRLASLTAENENLRQEYAAARKQIEDKEIEKIRVVKDKDRRIEELERERTNLMRDKETLEAKVGDILKSLKSLVPEAPAQGQ